MSTTRRAARRISLPATFKLARPFSFKCCTTTARRTPATATRPGPSSTAARDDLDGLINGNIHTTWYVDPDDSAGSSFELTASGLTSGEFANAFFTDDGNDSPTNITTQPGWLDVNGTNPVTTITAPAGFVITKVAIKSGSNSFAVPSPDNVDPGDDNTGDQHSGVIYVNGTYGLGNGFTVAGLGTGVVTVTKNAGTKDISHVDYMLGVAPTGGIGGMKFNDVDGDGVKDPGDGGLSGWTIQLDKDANGSVDATTVTDANGNYSFTGLTAGTYRIREVNQVGWTQTTVNPGDVTVVSGTNSTGNNFGNFQLGGISGMKFNDVDGDGVERPRRRRSLGLDDPIGQGCQWLRRCHDRDRCQRQLQLHGAYGWNVSHPRSQPGRLDPDHSESGRCHRRERYQQHRQ